MLERAMNSPFSRDFNSTTRRQRERLKNNRFNKQNNNFARFFVHFFAVFARLRRENAKFRVFLENVNKQRRNYISLSELGYGPLEFKFRRVRVHLTKKAQSKYEY